MALVRMGFSVVWRIIIINYHRNSESTRSAGLGCCANSSGFGTALRERGSGVTVHMDMVAYGVAVLLLLNNIHCNIKTDNQTHIHIYVWNVRSVLKKSN